MGQTLKRIRSFFFYIMTIPPIRHLRSIQDHKIDLSPLFERIKESYIDEIESIYIRNIQEVRFTETTMNFIEDFLKEEILVQEEI